MPDAHFGAGICIGGVIATRGIVVPNAVGVDIACRIKMSILDISAEAFEENIENLSSALGLGRIEFGVKLDLSVQRRGLLIPM